MQHAQKSELIKLLKGTHHERGAFIRTFSAALEGQQTAQSISVCYAQGNYGHEASTAEIIELLNARRKASALKKEKRTLRLHGTLVLRT